MHDSSDNLTEYDVALATTPAPAPEEDDCTDERKASQETIVKLLQSLSDAGTAENIGRKVLILIYQLKLDIDGTRTLEELGARFASGGELGVSKGRVSQILSALNPE